MAGVAGFEPTMAIPKTAALPLGYTPASITQISMQTKQVHYALKQNFAENCSP